MANYKQMSTLSAANPRNNNGVPYSYGTSGFRGLASTLDGVCLRMGMLAALRSLSCGKTNTKYTFSDELSPSSVYCRAIGVMVTASHNDECDNGLKLVDPTGEMLDSKWETTANEMANVEEEKLADYVAKHIADNQYDASLVPVVLLGEDTRPSSERLGDLVVAGARSVGAVVEHMGIVSTPQLHWMVYNVNQLGDSSVSDYNRTLADAFLFVMRNTKAIKEMKKQTTKKEKNPYMIEENSIIVDCANGVGALVLSEFIPLIVQSLLIHIRNAGRTRLNEGCGAEFVQKTLNFPGYLTGHEAANDFSLLKGQRLASFDGDADRLVYYFADSANALALLDGDKMLTLIAMYLTDLLKLAGLSESLTMGIVQTAYANGSSTHFIEERLGRPVVFTNTGVKFLHHVAKEYDIGVYFEANGHGTVIFSDKARQAFGAAAAAAQSSGPADERRLACDILAQLPTLVNQCVGDALSDLLLVECALAFFDWSLADWAALYADRPSSMLKVKIKDRTKVKTSNAERTCDEPKGLQKAIDKLVSEGNGARDRRAFVRPSGTEDIVRVYAEAATREEAKKLAELICKEVEKYAA